MVAKGYRRWSGLIRPASGGHTWWAHFAFTHMNTTPTILPKKIEDLSEAAGTGAKHYGAYRE